MSQVWCYTKGPISMSRAQVSLGNLSVFSCSMILLSVYLMEPLPDKDQEKQILRLFCDRSLDYCQVHTKLGKELTENEEKLESVVK